MSTPLQIHHEILRSEFDEAVAEVWWKPLDVTYTDDAFDNIGEKIYAFEDESPLMLKHDGPDGFKLVPSYANVSRGVATTVREEPRNVAHLKNLMGMRLDAPDVVTDDADLFVA